ncbi:MAG: CU044_2847 family protein [Streptomyces sp.]
MERGVQEIELPGGETVLAAVRVLEPDQVPDVPGGTYDFEDTGAFDRLAARVEQLNELVTGVGSAVLEAARAARPHEVSATFGVEIGVKPGKAVAMLADGEVKGSISVTLTWRPDGAADG